MINETAHMMEVPQSEFAPQLVSNSLSELHPPRELRGPKLVCIIDDDENDLEISASIVEGMGCYKVQTASDVPEFRRLGLVPDLLFLDIDMPGVTGKDFLSQLRRNGAKTPIIVILTSSSYSRDIQDCYHRGANAYLTKSYELGELRRSIRCACEFWLERSHPPLR